MSASRAPQQEIRLVVAPPSAVSGPLREAVREAAEARGVPVQDLVGIEGRTLEKGSVTLCADASGLDLSAIGRLVVVLGDPDQSAPAIRDWLALDGRDAVVFASRCFAHATNLCRDGATWAISEAEIRADPDGALVRLFEALDLAPTPVEAVALGARFRSALGNSTTSDQLSQVDAVARDALAVFRPSEDGKPSRAWCSRELFKWGDDPEAFPPFPMDVTGAARNLAFGPYMILPEGTWRATAIFDLDEEAAKRFFLLSFGSGAEFSHLETCQLQVGHNELSVTHQFLAPGPAEFSLGVPYGAFHGELCFSGLFIERVEILEADAPI